MTINAAKSFRDLLKVNPSRERQAPAALGQPEWPASKPCESSGRPRFWSLVKEDLATQNGDWTQAGFQAMLMYRIGNARPEAWLVAALMRRLYRASHVFVRNVYGIELHATAKVGRRVKIAHQGAIVIHGKAIIGDDCVIRQGVTIGGTSDAKRDIAPVFGNGVELGAGAVVVGGVRIGDGAKIGPNAVVMTNVPAGARVVVPAARIIPAFTR